MIAIGPTGLPEVHGGGLGRVEQGGNDLESVQYFLNPIDTIYSELLKFPAF